MAMRNVRILVIGRDGRPQSGKKVWLTGAHYGSGLSKEGSTGADGSVSWTVDYDQDVAIYVDGSRRVDRERIRADFRIVL